MPTGKILIPWPSKGFVEESSYAGTPELASPKIHNVLLLDQTFQRIRPAQRPGDGRYDLYNFATGQTESAGTITIGTDGGDGAINLSNRGCYVLNSSTSTANFTFIGFEGDAVPAACYPVTVLVNDPGTGHGTDNGGTSTITLTGGTPPAGGGGGGFIVKGQCQTNCDPPDPPTAKPWLNVRVCGTGEDTGFSVYQGILGVHNALPVIYDTNLANTFSGICLQVTGQRVATPLASRETNSATTTLQIFSTCDECNSPGNVGFLKYTVIYNCVTATWGDQSGPVKVCDTIANVSQSNSWVFDGSTATAERTYNYYMNMGTSCVTTADVSSSPTQDQVDEKYTKLTTLIGNPGAECGDPDSVTVRLYQLSTFTLLHTYTMTMTQDGLGHPLPWSYTGPSAHSIGGNTTAHLYSGSTICGDLTVSWVFDDFGYSPLGGLQHLHLDGVSSSSVMFGTYDECIENNDVYAVVE